jgi:amphi-Trp domain-containing protein
MSDVTVTNTTTMTRHEASRWFADVADALSADGPVALRLGGSTVELEMPDRVRFEAEVEVEGDEIEVEFELKWSTGRQDAAAPTKAAVPPKKDSAASK